ncbi:MAG: hypothetical protein QME78_14065 [Thermodesulfobacteriota bacterium]|nr:hypothetical protein [Thermodesulfobacteriota bacterium]
MKIDTEKIQRYLSEIKARHNEIEELLRKNSDVEILREPWVLKGLKYSIIEIAEAMANTLQHILAKDLGEPLTGYVETIIRAGEAHILPEPHEYSCRDFIVKNSIGDISASVWGEWRLPPHAGDRKTLGPDDWNHPAGTQKIGPFESDQREKRWKPSLL